MLGKTNRFAASLVLLTATVSVSAASHPFEYHADARMQHESIGPIDQAYGYMNIVTDDGGNGTINVMFFNGTGLDLAQFNARVKFLDNAGAVLREENFDCWLDAEGLDEAIECKITKPLVLNSFESIEVDFYLSEIEEISATLVY